MRLETLKDFYVHELQDLFNAESRLIEALPKMAEKASSEDVRKAFSTHLDETREHKNRLQRIMDDLSVKPGGTKCEAMEGLIKESEQILKAQGDGSTIDAGLLAMGNRIEHYEIAGYGAARAHANELGLDEHARVLQTTLSEEGDADKKLTALAQERNRAATPA